MPDEKNNLPVKASYDFPKKKSSVGIEIYRGHGFLNGAMHSGFRIGNTTFPWALMGAGYGLYRSVRNGRNMKREIRELQDEEVKWESLIGILAKEEQSGGGVDYVTQTVLVSKDAFSRAGAKRWIREHGFFLVEPGETINYWTFQQMDPSYCSEKQILIDEPPLGPDIKLLRCIPRGSITPA